MRTQAVRDPLRQGVVIYNSARWQVTRFLNGYACELLKKECPSRLNEHARQALRPENYPSVFFQGDASQEFLVELDNATKKLPRRDVEALLFSEYDHVLE